MVLKVPVFLDLVCSEKLKVGCALNLVCLDLKEEVMPPVQLFVIERRHGYFIPVYLDKKIINNNKE